MSAKKGDLKQESGKAISTRPEDNLILVDCNGTIFDGPFGDRNTELIKFLAAMKSVGHQIQIFSDNPSAVQDRINSLQRILANKGLNFEFGEVHRKDMYDGKKAFIVVDDDHSAHNVDAAYEYSPMDERIVKTLKYAGIIDSEFGVRRLN